MTPSQFRNHALSVNGCVESAHMGHADFRLRDKIFSTLGYPNDTCAMVKLTPEQQQQFIGAHPEVFSPSPGAWGKKGSTKILLPTATQPVVCKALATAAKNIAETYSRPSGFKP